MKSTTLAVSIGASIISLVSAAGTLQLGIVGKQELGGSPALRLKRANSGTVQTSVTNDKYATSYYVNVTIGSPPQNVQLVVDTGSSDIWTVSKGAAICSTSPGCESGTFDYTKSTTFKDNGPGLFKASYLDGTATTGDYFKDTFGIGGASVNQFQMGLAQDSSIPQGIMGIAFNTAEGGGTVQYPNLVDTMVNQSIIATQAYSLWLDDRASRTGSILFGGIDTGKFEGDLANIAMYESEDTGIIDRFTVAFTSLSITSPSGTDVLTAPGYAAAVVLDSGTTITYLPDKLATSIYNEVGAFYDDTLEAALCDCFTGAVDGTLNFGFAGANGITIRVPISELVSPVFQKDGSEAKFKNNEPACFFGIGPSSSLGEGASILFGDTLLRSAYVVYDLANFRVGLAQTNFNSTESNIIAFPSLGANIPSATTVVDENAVTQTASVGVVGGPAPEQTPAPSLAPLEASGLFTGLAGPGFQTAATQTGAVATGTGAPKKNNGARRIPISVLGMGMMGLLVGIAA